MNYNSIQEIKQILSAEGLGMTKKFGQNFLISAEAREKIISALGPVSTDTVWEIGPGLGAMTEMLYGRVQNLTVFEIDYGFAGFLKKTFPGGDGHFNIITGDFLKTGLPLLEEGNGPDKIMGNLPYSSGSAMIFKIVESGNYPENMVYTVQREVGERLAARPGTKSYSLFSLICSVAYSVVSHGDIQPGSFYPQPKVVSRIIELQQHHRYDKFRYRKLFFTLAKDIFSARRKMIKNNLLSGKTALHYSKEQILEALEESGISPSLRGETLSAEDIIRLAGNLKKGAAK